MAPGTVIQDALSAPGPLIGTRKWQMLSKNRRPMEPVARALNHGCRLRILEMHWWARGRPLSVETLTAALSQTREYRDVTAATVNYHLSRLRDAELLPS
jgi:DNA-binding transcriptional ArsR family regulator